MAQEDVFVPYRNLEGTEAFDAEAEIINPFGVSSTGSSLSASDPFTSYLIGDTEPQDLLLGIEPVTPSNGMSQLTGVMHKQEMNRLGFWESFADWDKSHIPFAGDFYDAKRIMSVLNVTRKLNNGQPVTDEEMLMFQNYMTEQERLQNATIGAKVMEITKNMVKFMGEIGAVTAATILTAGFAAPALGKEIAEEAAKIGARKGVNALTKRMAMGRMATKALRDQGKKKFASAIGNHAARLGSKAMTPAAAAKVGNILFTSAEIGTKGAALTLVNQGMAKRAIAERKLENVMRGEDEDAHNAVALGIIDAWIEHSSEMAGEALGASVGAILGKFGVKGKKVSDLVLGGGALHFLASKGVKGMDEAAMVLQSMGHNQLVEEMLEERFGGFMRGLLGVRGEAGIVNAMKESIPATWEDAVVEMIAFSVPGTITAAGGYAASAKGLHGAGIDKRFRNQKLVNEWVLNQENYAMTPDEIKNSDFMSALQEEALEQENNPPSSAFLRTIDNLHNFFFGGKAGSIESILAQSRKVNLISHYLNEKDYYEARKKAALEEEAEAEKKNQERKAQDKKPLKRKANPDVFLEPKSQARDHVAKMIALEMQVQTRGITSEADKAKFKEYADKGWLERKVWSDATGDWTWVITKDAPNTDEFIRSMRSVGRLISVIEANAIQSLHDQALFGLDDLITKPTFNGLSEQEKQRVTEMLAPRHGVREFENLKTDPNARRFAEIRYNALAAISRGENNQHNAAISEGDLVRIGEDGEQVYFADPLENGNVRLFNADHVEEPLVRNSDALVKAVNPQAMMVGAFGVLGTPSELKEVTSGHADIPEDEVPYEDNGEYKDNKYLVRFNAMNTADGRVYYSLESSDVGAVEDTLEKYFKLKNHVLGNETYDIGEEGKLFLDDVIKQIDKQIDNFSKIEETPSTQRVVESLADFREFIDTERGATAKNRFETYLKFYLYNQLGYGVHEGRVRGESYLDKAEFYEVITSLKDSGQDLRPQVQAQMNRMVGIHLLGSMAANVKTRLPKGERLVSEGASQEEVDQLPGLEDTPTEQTQQTVAPSPSQEEAVSEAPTLTQPTDFRNIEEYKGKPVTQTTMAVSGRRFGVKADRRTRGGKIKIDPDGLEAAWNDYQQGRTRLDGVDISEVTELRNLDDFSEFAIEHERQHLELKKNSGESKADYEARINEAVLRELSGEQQQQTRPQAEPTADRPSEGGVEPSEARPAGKPIPQAVEDGLQNISNEKIRGMFSEMGGYLSDIASGNLSASFKGIRVKKVDSETIRQEIEDLVTREAGTIEASDKRVAQWEQKVKRVLQMFDDMFGERNVGKHILYKYAHGERFGRLDWRQAVDGLREYMMGADKQNGKKNFDSIIEIYSNMEYIEHRYFLIDPDTGKVRRAPEGVKEDLPFATSNPRNKAFGYTFAGTDGNLRQGLRMTSLGLRVLNSWKLGDGKGRGHYLLDGSKLMRRVDDSTTDSDKVDSDHETEYFVGESATLSRKLRTSNRKGKSPTDMSEQELQDIFMYEFEIGTDAYYMHIGRFGEKEDVHMIEVDKLTGKDLQQAIEDYLKEYNALDEAEKKVLYGEKDFAGLSDWEKNDYLNRYKFGREVFGRYDIFKDVIDMNKRLNQVFTPGIMYRGAFKAFVFDDHDLFDGAAFFTQDILGKDIAEALGPLIVDPNNLHSIKAFGTYLNVSQEDGGSMISFKPQFYDVEQLQHMGKEYKKLFEYMKQRGVVAIPKSALKVNGAYVNGKQQQILPVSTDFMSSDGTINDKVEVETFDFNSFDKEGNALGFAGPALIITQDFNYSNDLFTRFTLKQADSIRMHMPKQYVEEQARLEEKMIRGFIENSVSTDLLDDVLMKELRDEELDIFLKIRRAIKEEDITADQILTGPDRHIARNVLVSAILKRTRSVLPRTINSAVPADPTDKAQDLTPTAERDRVHPMQLRANVEGDGIRYTVGDVFASKEAAANYALENKEQYPWMFEFDLSGGTSRISEGSLKRNLIVEEKDENGKTRYYLPGTPVFAIRIPAAFVTFTTASYLHSAIGEQSAMAGDPSFAIVTALDNWRKGQDFDADQVMINAPVARSDGTYDLSEATLEGIMNRMFFLWHEGMTKYSEAMTHYSAQPIQENLFDKFMFSEKRWHPWASTKGQEQARDLMSSGLNSAEIFAANAHGFRILDYLDIKMSEDIDLGNNLILSRKRELSESDRLMRDHFWNNTLISILIDDIKEPRSYRLGINKQTAPLLLAMAIGNTQSETWPEMVEAAGKMFKYIQSDMIKEYASRKKAGEKQSNILEDLSEKYPAEIEGLINLINLSGEINFLRELVTLKYKIPSNPYELNRLDNKISEREDGGAFKMLLGDQLMNSVHLRYGIDKLRSVIETAFGNSAYDFPSNPNVTAEKIVKRVRSLALHAKEDQKNTGAKFPEHKVPYREELYNRLDTAQILIAISSDGSPINHKYKNHWKPLKAMKKKYAGTKAMKFLNMINFYSKGGPKKIQLTDQNKRNHKVGEELQEIREAWDAMDLEDQRILYAVSVGNNSITRSLWAGDYTHYIGSEYLNHIMPLFEAEAKRWKEGRVSDAEIEAIANYVADSKPWATYIPKRYKERADVTEPTPTPSDQQPQRVDSSDVVTESPSIPEHTIDRNLKNSDGSKRLGRSTADGEIIINPVASAEEFFNYFEGREVSEDGIESATSMQKGIVLNMLRDHGYPVDYLKEQIDTADKANEFIVRHEQSHIENNDRDVYWKSGKGLLAEDKLDIEVRSSVDALNDMGIPPQQTEAQQQELPGLEQATAKREVKRRRAEEAETLQRVDEQDMDSPTAHEIPYQQPQSDDVTEATSSILLIKNSKPDMIGNRTFHQFYLETSDYARGEIKYAESKANKFMRDIGITNPDRKTELHENLLMGLVHAIEEQEDIIVDIEEEENDRQDLFDMLNEDQNMSGDTPTTKQIAVGFALYRKNKKLLGDVQEFLLKTPKEADSFLRTAVREAKGNEFTTYEPIYHEKTVSQIKEEWDNSEYAKSKSTKFEALKQRAIDLFEESITRENLRGEGIEGLGKNYIKRRSKYVYHLFDLPEEEDKDRADLLRQLYTYKEKANAEKVRSHDTYFEAAVIAGLLPAHQDVLKLYNKRTIDTQNVLLNKVMLSQSMLLTDLDGQPMVLPIIRDAELLKKHHFQRASIIPDQVFDRAGRQLVDWINQEKLKKNSKTEKPIEWKGLADPKEQYKKLIAKYEEMIKGNLARAGYVKIGSGLENFKSFDGFWVKKGPTQKVMSMLVDKIEEGSFWDKIAKYNSIAKEVNLAFSLFHPFSLFESMAATYGITTKFDNPFLNLFVIKKEFNSITELYEHMRDNPEAYREWIAAGLNVDMGNPDIETGYAGEWLTNIKELDVPLLSQGADALRYGRQQFSKLLWTRLHPAMKLYMAQRVFNDVKNNPDNYQLYQSVSDDVIRRDIAELIDNAFGGQNLERNIWMVPKVRRALHLLMFAPDWTLSALRIAANIIPGFGDVINPTASPLQKQWARRRYWPAMVGVVMFAIPNALQLTAYAAGKLAGTDDEDDKPFVWQNEVGKKEGPFGIPGFGAIDITPVVRMLPGYTGSTSGKRRVYIRFAKQATEIFEGWIDRPLQQAFNKSSVAVKTVGEQIYGQTLGGWDLDFHGLDFTESLIYGKEQGIWGGRVAYIGRKFLPMSALSILEGRPSTFVAPTSRGLSKSAAQTKMKMILENYANERNWNLVKDNPRRKKNLEELFPQLLDAVERNGYDPIDTYKAAKRSVLGRLYNDFFTALNKGDEKKLERVARSIKRVHGTFAGLQKSMKSKYKNTDRRFTPELREQAQTAFNQQAR